MGLVLNNAKLLDINEECNPEVSETIDDVTRKDKNSDDQRSGALHDGIGICWIDLYINDSNKREKLDAHIKKEEKIELFVAPESKRLKYATVQDLSKCKCSMCELNLVEKCCISKHTAASHDAEDNCEKCYAQFKSNLHLSKHVELPGECLEREANNSFLCRWSHRKHVRLKHPCRQCEFNSFLDSTMNFPANKAHMRKILRCEDCGCKAESECNAMEPMHRKHARKR